MADVWIMTNGVGEGEEAWKSGVQAVILPNRRVIAKSNEDKNLLEEQIEEAQERYNKYGGGSGEIPIDKLFDYLEGLHTSPYHLGFVVPVEEAREYVKLSGGL